MVTIPGWRKAASSALIHIFPPFKEEYPVFIYFVFTFIFLKEQTLCLGNIQIHIVNHSESDHISSEIQFQHKTEVCEV